MRLKEIPVQEVLMGKNWLIRYASKEDVPNPVVEESATFKPGDAALFSAVTKMADGSDHPTLAVKIFDDGGHHQIQTFIYTKTGWTDAMSEGFFRVVGKYAHDVFPFEVYIASPWSGDTDVGEKAEDHRRMFFEAVPRMQAVKYDVGSTTRRWPFGPR